MVNKFDAVINSSGIRFDESALQRARLIIMENQRYIYKRVNNGTGPVAAPGFDQNNFSIQGNVSKMKYEVSLALYQKKLPNPRSQIGYIYLGDLATLETTLTKDKIAEYVKNALTITCANNERIVRDLFCPNYIAYDILTHFGLDISLAPEIQKILERVCGKATIGLDQVPGNSDTGFRPIYNREETRMDVYNNEINNAITEITGIVFDAVSKLLENTRIHAQSLKQTQPPESVQQQRPVQPKKAGVPRPQQPKKKKQNQNPNTSNPQGEIPVADLQKAIEGYQRLQKLAAENESISAQLQALAAEIAKVSKQLEDLKAQKRKIEAQLSTNNGEMRACIKKQYG